MRFLAVAAVILLVACSDGADAPSPAAEGAQGAPASTSSTSTEAPSTTTRPEPTWQTVAGGEDCGCSDGSDFSFGIRADDPEQVVFYLEGGGACFSAESCAPATATYSPTVVRATPAGRGIFDVDEPANPVAGWSAVYVPYCTGDIHLGTTTTDYGDGVVIDHFGHRNASFALDTLAERFPDAREILVAGVSAGSAPAPLYAGLVADRFPDARVAVLADGSGAYPSVPAVNALIGDRWGTVGALPDWDGLAEVDADQVGIPDLYAFAAAEHPDIVFGRYDFAFDAVQVFFAGLAGFGAGALVEAIDANEAAAEARGAEISAYVAPGADHTIITSDAFYDQEVDGVALVDWVDTLVGFDHPGDVHCTACEG